MAKLRTHPTVVCEERCGVKTKTKKKKLTKAQMRVQIAKDVLKHLASGKLKNDSAIDPDDGAPTHGWSQGRHRQHVSPCRVCDNALSPGVCNSDYIKARWGAWMRGYGCLCDVDGVLYVYGTR